MWEGEGALLTAIAATHWRCSKARLRGSVVQEKKMCFTIIILPALPFIGTKFHIIEKHETSLRC